jgi:diaminopimelate decarboxylase
MLNTREHSKKIHYPRKHRKRNFGIRHTHRTIAGLEDGVAIALDLLSEYDALADYARTRLQKLTRVLQDVRKGPHNYNPDQSSGQRFGIRRRMI